MANRKPQLTLHQENYLETIYRLCRQHGHAHTKTIADDLNVRMPSVTEALSLLAEKKLIHYELRKTITLTETGKLIAEELEQRHDVLKDFYQNILGLPRAKANKIACKVEHVVDKEFAERLADFHKFLKQELVDDCKRSISNFKNRYK